MKAQEPHNNSQKCGVGSISMTTMVWPESCTPEHMNFSLV